MKTRSWTDPRLWVGLPISGFLFWLAARGIPFGDLIKVMREAQYAWMIPAVLATYGVIWVRAKRWCVLMRGIKRVRPSTAFRATAIGFTVNYVIPVRVGELLRAYLVGQRENMSGSAAFATVVVERLLDIICILMIFILLLIFVPGSQKGSQLFSLLRTAAVISLAILMCTAVVLWIVRRRIAWIGRPVEFFLGRIWPRGAQRLVGILEGFSKGLIPSMTKSDILAIVFYTLALWGLTAGGIRLVANGFGLGLPLEAPLVILVALAFGVSVPSAPGFLGTFHYAAVVALMLYGIPKTEALSYAIALHAASILPVFFLGMGLLWAEGLRMGKIMRDELKLQ
jgi:hypothetical protein